jgi:hypothetical protein
MSEREYCLRKYHLPPLSRLPDCLTQKDAEALQGIVHRLACQATSDVTFNFDCGSVTIRTGFPTQSPKEQPMNKTIVPKTLEEAAAVYGAAVAAQKAAHENEIRAHLAVTDADADVTGALQDLQSIVHGEAPQYALSKQQAVNGGTGEIRIP